MSERCKDLVLLARGEKTIEEITTKNVGLLTPQQRRKSLHIVQNVPSPGAYQEVYTNDDKPARKCQRSKSHNPTSARSVNETFCNMSATKEWVLSQDFTAMQDDYENMQSYPCPEPPTNNSITTAIGSEEYSSIISSSVSLQSDNTKIPRFGVRTRGGLLNKVLLTRKGVKTIGGHSTINKETDPCDTNDNDIQRSLSPEHSQSNISVATVITEHYIENSRNNTVEDKTDKKVQDYNAVQGNDENIDSFFRIEPPTSNSITTAMGSEDHSSIITSSVSLQSDNTNIPRFSVRTRGRLLHKVLLTKKGMRTIGDLSTINKGTNSCDTETANIINRQGNIEHPSLDTNDNEIPRSSSSKPSRSNMLEKRLQDIVGINVDIPNERQDKINKVTDLTDSQLLQALLSDEESDVDLDGNLGDREELVNLQDIILDELVSEGETQSDQELENHVPNVDAETWFDNAVPKQKLNFERDGTVLKVYPIDDGDRPVDYFFLLADDIFFKFIIDRANSNAAKLLSRTTARNSRLKAWRNITMAEIKTFFGILFHMGIIKLNRVSDYWKKDFLFNIPCFANYMSRNRFLLIFRALHFEDPNSEPSSRLSKIAPLVDYFNDIMRKIYYPSRNLSIDESVVLFRGRLIFRQYLKGKRHPYGIKLYILTDMHGVILKIIVYGGAGDPVVGGTNHTEKVVMNLLADYLDVGHSLYIDNFLNSINLAKKLITRKTYCTGTLRSYRKGTPTAVASKKLKKGETIAKFSSSGICVLKWNDRRDVLVLSTEFDSKVVEVTPRFGPVVQKPEIVTNYNKYMGGIDHQDQMLAYYSCERKCLRWYKKLGVHIFQQMLYNSFTLYNIFSGRRKMSFYEFKLSVIENLLDPRVQPEPQRLSNVHVLQPCPRKLGSKGKKLRRRCKFCWGQNKQRKDTGHYCPDCPDQPGFCEVDCFRLYHKY